METDTWPIYQQTLGRYIGRDSVECRSTWTNKHVRRHPADTLPPLGCHSAATRPMLNQHSANTKLTWSALATEFYLLCSTERGFQWPSSFFAFNSGNIHVFFPAMFCPRHRFYIRPSLLLDVAAFGDCCFFRVFVWVPSFPTQCLSRSCITYVFEMAAVWAASSLYQHMSIGDELFFLVTFW